MGKYILQSALLCPTHSRRDSPQNGEIMRRLRERTESVSAFYSLFLLFSMFLRSFLKNNCAKFAFYAIRKGGKNVEFGTTFCINSTAFCMNTNGYLLQNTMQSPTKRNANSYKTQC